MQNTASNSGQDSGSGISSYASAGGFLLGPILTAIGNRKNRKAQEKANRQNREHQLEMWNMTNEYNTPLQQRIRMEEAGFNPHHQAGAMQNTASNQNLPDYDPYLPDQNTYTQAGQALGNHFQQVMNNEVMRNKAISDADATDAKGNLTKEQEHQLRSNRTTNIALRQQQLDSQVLDNAKKQMFNSQMPQIHRARMLESMQRISNMRSVLSTEQLKRELLKEELELRKLGINPNTDGIFMRFMVQMIGAENVRSFLTNKWY